MCSREMEVEEYEHYDAPKCYQNRGTMGVQIPFSFPKGLDFKPFQAKVRGLPWQMNSIFIITSNFLSFLGLLSLHFNKNQAILTDYS